MQRENLIRFQFYTSFSIMMGLGAFLTWGAGVGVMAATAVMLLWVVIMDIFPAEPEIDVEQIRRDERKRCWEEINAAIKKGPLESIPHAERNGMVAARDLVLPPRKTPNI